MTAQGVIVDPTTSGIVTDHLRLLLSKQVEDHCLVVWYDPEGYYRQVAGSLSFPRATVTRYDGSFFRLRKEIDHLLNDLNPPRLVVYVPLDQAKTHHALIELEAAGVVMQPGQQPPNRNTRLAILARNALRPLIGDETAAEVEKQVESGKLSLADLDKLAGKGKEISTGVLTLIFGNANPQDVALAFLGSEKYDPEVTKKTATKELLGLLQNAFEVEFPAKAGLPQAREHFARHVLLTDLVTGLGDTVPSSLASVPVATTASSREHCRTLARNWRLRRDHRDSYLAAAKKVEHDFSLATLDFEPGRLRDMETFLACERGLLRARRAWAPGSPRPGSPDAGGIPLLDVLVRGDARRPGPLGTHRLGGGGAAGSRSGRSGTQGTPGDRPRLVEVLCRG